MTAAEIARGIEIPAVTEDEALGDRDWFATHPHRRYRARRADRGCWLVRKRSGGVLLRTWTATLPQRLPDTDKALRVAWFDAAWRDLPAEEREELVRRAAAAEGG